MLFPYREAALERDLCLFPNGMYGGGCGRDYKLSLMSLSSTSLFTMA